LTLLADFKTALGDWTKHWNNVRKLLDFNFLVSEKDKVLPYSLPSVRPRADPGVQAVCPQSTFKSSPAVGCHYFPQGLQSPSQQKNVTVLRLVPSYTAWWQKHIGVNNFPKVATQMVTVRRWDSNPRPADRKFNALPLSHLRYLWYL